MCGTSTATMVAQQPGGGGGGGVEERRESNAAEQARRRGDGGIVGLTSGTAAAAAPRAPPALSPRFLSAESRLAQEKAWLADGLPQHCHAEPSHGSDFVWSFKVSGLHGTLYQVRREKGLALLHAADAAAQPRAALSCVLHYPSLVSEAGGRRCVGGRASSARESWWVVAEAVRGRVWRVWGRVAVVSSTEKEE